MNATLIVTLVVAVVGVFAGSGFWHLIESRLNKKDECRSTENDALMGLLHDRIYEICEKALRRDPRKIYISEFDNLEHLANPYFNMGGNGTGRMLYEEVKKLPKDTGDPLEQMFESYINHESEGK